MEMKNLIQPATAMIVKLSDAISKLTGIRAFVEQLPCPKGAVALDVTGYRQTESATCGFIAALTVATYLKPSVDPKKIYRWVGCTEEGSTLRDVTSALRRCGITVRKRATMTFEDFTKAIDAGHLVIVSVVSRISEDVGHWATSYGYRRRPKAVLLSGFGVPLMVSTKVVPWSEFRARWWEPEGNGMICSLGK